MVSNLSDPPAAPITPRPTRPGGDQPSFAGPPADAGELRAALRLVLGQEGHPAPEAAAIQFASYAQARGIEVSNLRLARVGKRVAFAALPLRSPGRTALVLCPTGIHGVSTHVAADAIRQVLDLERQAGTALAQALLPPRAAGLREAFEACGFVALSELVYLSRPARRPPRPRDLALPPGLSVIRYSPAVDAMLAEAIERSYTGSLDCPGLAGKRPIEDVIAGHRAAGEFRPEWWHLLVEHAPGGAAGRPIGVLLLSGIGGAGGAGGLELVYLGLAPEARGRGLGDVLLHHAALAASRTPGRAITLAVDAQNAPALALYRRHGFKRMQTRLALVCDV